MRAKRWIPRKDERGATAVIVGISMLLFFLATAFAVDLGTLVMNRQDLRNALDSGALAGAGLLPADPAGARDAAMRFALDNRPSLTSADVRVEFRCLAGDRDGDGRADSQDVPIACDPGASAGFTCDRGLCSAVCDPFGGDVCNTIVLAAGQEVSFAFAPVAGVRSGNTGDVESAACSGHCGTAPLVPIDIGIIVDRTRSMSDADLANVKRATEAMLGFFDPAVDHVALGVIHRSSTTSRCSNGGYGISISSNDYSAGRGTWIPAPYPAGSLVSDYENPDGTLNGSSRLVRTIRCLQHSTFSTYQGQTDIGSPLRAMSDFLQQRGRPGVKKAIMLMTDGEANLPSGTAPCGYAATQATRTKSVDIELFTVGFGISDKRCEQDGSGAYRNARVERLLAEMATQPSDDDGCTDAENADGDHYFCEPRSGDLSQVFVRVAAAITTHPRLVRLPR